VNSADLDNPILNSPYEAPERHFAIGRGGPTGEILPGRRQSESFIPIPVSRKGKKAGEQTTFDFDVTGERIEENTLINDIRRQIELWRGRRYPGVTPISRKLLEHWAGNIDVREDRMLFCQREAAETAIYLAEVAGRKGEPDYRVRLDEQNRLHNDGLPRTALKMATGSGKTVVMAMLIAWQTINKVYNPRHLLFAKRFLVITPGITIRDRLRVLQPSAPDNYYRQRDLVPADLWGALEEAQIIITNYHTFQLKDSAEIKGVAPNTRKLLNGGKLVDPFKETPADMVSRVLRDFGGRAGGEILVLNDEAHHCYQDKVLIDADADADADDKARNADARVWFKGLQAMSKKIGIKKIYDLSATPFYLKGSGYNEGYIFPWTVSDFSLMDAIESGIVKVPRVPIDDDATGDLPTYLRLWDHIGDQLPKRLPKEELVDDWVPPKVLEGALESLHRSYRSRFEEWERTLAAHGEPPPVMIVVCPNTTVSKLVYDWIAGKEIEAPNGEKALRSGKLELLSNTVDGQWLHRPRTILIDSAVLESGESFKDDFKKAAGREVEAFKAEYRRRNPGADVDKITDEDLLREVMNTVGKKDMLGEHIRCVVSVSMLTEGWDANTVTHILGVRAFRSQLLCEQVVGRGLRRRSYAPNDDDRFEPEYADVYGVPFAFIPSDRPAPTPRPSTPSTEVRALSGRDDLEIRFPKLDGYRIEMPDAWLFEDFGPEANLHVTRNELAVWVQTSGIAGAVSNIDLEEYRNARPHRVAYEIAALLVKRFYTAHDAAARPWLFPRLSELAGRWLRECVTFGADAFVGLLLPAQHLHAATEKLFGVILNQEGKRSEVLVPMFRRFDPEGSTADVDFLTRKVVVEATKSQVSHVVLDGIRGNPNTWEEGVAAILEKHSDVGAFVKNDHLGFTIPYVYEGRSHQYWPDFLVRLNHDISGQECTLIIEVSGGQKSPGPTQAKADTARDLWCAAVNNHGGWGRWGYIEIKDIAHAGPMINQAIKNMSAASFFTDALAVGVL
jgi:type III restriction enzyme